MKLEIEGVRIRLRKLKISDARDIYDNIRDEEVVRWLLRILDPYSFNDALKFIRRTQYRIRKNKGYAFGIVLKETGRVVGVVDLFNIDWENRNAEMGYWLGRRYWNRGLMTEAVKLALKFAFQDLKLHRVSATIFEGNLASRRVLEKAGFKLEGKRREARLKFGRWQNELIYGILKSEYERC
ncbi:MAG: GNAT family N-acetyltransferase [Archaeoglobus sp.]|nr:GNAT family N-acetyltransferase [Archaeoglobus sp.]